MKSNTSTAISDYVMSIIKDQGEYAEGLLCELPFPYVYSLNELDISEEEFEEKDSYLLDLNEEDRIMIEERAKRDNHLIFEVILPMDNDAYALFFVGKDEDDVLQELKKDMAELGTMDL